MTKYIEGNLCLSVADGLAARNFDDSSHGLAHCMKAVDFIVEIPSHILLIEFKDPDHPSAHETNRADFLAKFSSGNLDVELTQKYRDSWLYLRASGPLPEKPFRYFVLVACENLTSAELTVRTDELRKKLPLKGVGGQDWSWFIQDCAVFSLASWNANLPQLQITRT